MSNNVTQCNSMRLLAFLAELVQKFDPEVYADLLYILDEDETNLVNKLESLNWIPADQELQIIKKICQKSGDYADFHKASKNGMFKFLEETLPLNPYYKTYKDIFCALPSFIYFWKHLNSCNMVYDQDHYSLKIAFEKEELIETIFISALVQGLIEYLKIPQAGLYISNMTIPETENVYELFRLNPLLKYSSNLVEIKIFIEEDLLNQFVNKSSLNRAEISLNNHKESQKKIFVKQVLARSARIFQDKRELTTAVEYLNFANDALEKKIIESDKELNIAKNIQNGLIPQFIPDWNGLRFFTFSEALTTVSGDFYDYFNLDNGSLAFLIADVCGHGVPAALISALAKISFSNHSQLSPKNVLSNVNLDLIRYVKMEGYLTAVYLTIDKNLKLSYSLGGIPTPILLQTSGETKILKGEGALLGMFPDAGELFEDHSVQLQPGDKLFLFTDGITEANNTSGEQLGLENLQDYIKETLSMDVDESGNHILKKYKEYIRGEKVTDDTTLLVIQISSHLEFFHKYCNVAKEHFQNDELEQTGEALRNAIHIFPSRPEILYSLAKILLELDRSIEAIEISNQILALIPNHPGAIVIKALHAIKNNKLELAQTQLRHALALQENNKQALYHLIRVLIRENNIEEARLYFQKFKNLHPKSKTSIQLLEKHLKRIVE